jgi:uncharacterized protein (TIGR03437 family)
MNKPIEAIIKPRFLTAFLLVVAGLAAAQSPLPLGTYTIKVTASDNPPESFLIATWDQTLLEGNRYRVLRNGVLALEGVYVVTSEQIVFDEGRGPYACAGDGSGTYRWTLNGNKLTLTAVTDRCAGRRFVLTLRPLSLIGQAATVSAASFRAPVSAEAIVSAFGAYLAPSAASAQTTPLPTALVGTTVSVKDLAGAERAAPLFFVSPGQVNFQVPPGTAPGAATVTITSGDGSVATGTVTVAATAPGLFAANADGQGVAAAVALRIKSDGSSLYEPVARYDATANPPKFVALPIDLGSDAETVFLILYGTGIRFRSSLTAVTASIGGTAAQVDFVGPAPGLVGLDQVNVRLPRSLVRRGEVEIALTVDGLSANLVRVNIK